MVSERDELRERERQAREESFQASANLDAFLYTVSHDLKSPLFALFGYLDLLKLECGDRLGDTVVYVDRMAGAADYMQRLINDLLTLSRVGRADGRPDDVDLGWVAAGVAEELGRDNAAARFDIGPLPLVHLSPTRAHQLLHSLLDNAVRHSGRSDVTVRVTAERTPDGGARVVVSDDGRGVPEEDRERMFRVFERLADRGSGAGTGVGLALCRKIVENLGGEIRMVDATVGTSVEIVLPADVVRRQEEKVSAGA